MTFMLYIGDYLNIAIRALLPYRANLNISYNFDPLLVMAYFISNCASSRSVSYYYYAL
jgi:hypothetical protein